MAWVVNPGIRRRRNTIPGLNRLVDMDDLYRDEIMDHYKNPRNKGVVEDPDVRVEETNASCGDEVVLTIKTKRANEIGEIKFEGEGCAVSMAFASILLERVKEEGMTVEQVWKMSEEEMVEMIGGGGVSPARQKCLRLGIKALRRAVSKLKVKNQKSKPITASNSSKMIDRAVEVLRGGGVVCFPTDTVWGVGAAVSSRKGVEKLYQVMERDNKKPTAILVSDVDMANRYGVMNKKTRELAKKYWPGAVTVVVEARGNKVPKMVRGGGDSIGLRAPKHKVVQELVKRLGKGLVASSANVAGGREPRKRDEIEKEFEKKVDMVIEGEAGGTRASTVIGVEGEEVKVLRQGEVEIFSS